MFSVSSADVVFPCRSPRSIGLPSGFCGGKKGKKKTMSFIFIGDVVGKGGREAVHRLVPDLRREYNAQFVVVNGENIELSGKNRYVYVDVFDHIDFDLSKPQGAIVTLLNGSSPDYMQKLNANDKIEVYWQK